MSNVIVWFVPAFAVGALLVAIPFLVRTADVYGAGVIVPLYDIFII